LINLLGAAATGLSDAIEASAAAASGLDGAAPAALIALLDFSPAGTVEALSRIVGLTHSGAVRLVDRLANHGYVERTAGRNARSVTITLTAEGADVARRIRVARHDAITRQVRGLTRDQRASLTGVLESLIAATTKQRLAERAAGDPPAGGTLCRMCDFGACGRPAGRCPAALTSNAALRGVIA
jgi:MarR family transcriptional regulator, negative regulator of the multidrug operon emrRAB